MHVHMYTNNATKSTQTKQTIPHTTTDTTPPQLYYTNTTTDTTTAIQPILQLMHHYYHHQYSMDITPPNAPAATVQPVLQPAPR